jgi:hypothetical protein
MSNVTGELGGQPIILENAATEATMYALLQATLANNSNKSQAAKIQQAYEEAVKRTTKEQVKNSEQNSRNRLAIAEELAQREALNKKIEEEKERRKKLMQGLDELGQVIGKSLGAAFGSATPKVSDFTDALSGIPILGPIIGAVGKAMQDQIDKFRELSTVGADFGGGIERVRSVAAAAGLSLETYTKTVTENGKSLAMLGGNTTAGAKIFGEVNKSLQGPFQQSLARLGFSMEETAEYTAGYLAQQTRLGRAQRMTQQELNEGAQDYLLQLDMLSRVTGMSRKEAQAALDAQTADKRFKLFYAQMGSMGDQTKNFMAGLSVANKDFSDGIADLIMNNGVPSASNEMAQSIALQSPRLVALAQQLREGTISQEEANKVVREEAARMEELAKTQGKTQAQFLNLGSNVNLVNSSLVGMSNYGNKAADAAEAQRKAAENAARDQANLDKALLDLRNTIMNALMPVFNILAGVITKSIPAITEFVTKFSNIVKDGGIKEGLIFVMKEIGSLLGAGLSSMLKELFTSPAVIAGLVGGIGILFAASAAKQILVKKIEEAMYGGDPKKGGWGVDGKGNKEGHYRDASGRWRDVNTDKLSKGPPSELPKGSGMGGKLLSGLKGFGVGSILGIGGSMAADALGRDTKAGAGADVLGTTASYAGTGALLGSVVPGVGTAIGGAVGGVVGAGMGLWNNRKTLFGGSEKKPESGDMAKAAEVAQVTTAAEVKEMVAALKDLDYTKLIIPDTAHTSMETGTIKMRQLRGEVIAMTAAFKDLNNTGLDKITQGLGRLDESFKSFNKSFVQDFMEKFKELDKKSQEQLLTDLNDKMDLLNTSVKSLVDINENQTRYSRDTARNTKSASGRVN